MIRALFTRGALVLAAAAIMAPAEARAQPAIPDTPAGRRAAAFLKTLMSGNAAAVRAFISEQVIDEEIRQIPADQQVRAFAHVRGELAGYQLATVTEQPNEVTLTFTGADRPLWLSIEVEPVPPHRITHVGFGSGAPRRDPSPPLAPEVQAQVVDSIARLLEAFYVVPDSGRMIAAKLRERAAAGAYTPFNTRESFARALNADFRSVNDDPHLSVLTRIAGAGMGPGYRSTPADDGYRYLDRVEMLNGQVGYLKLKALAHQPEAMEELGRALRSLEGSRTMVIDLRGALGGSEQMANALVSHFTEPGLLTIREWTRPRPDTVQRRTLSGVPGPRRTDVPLFVLVDSGTVGTSEEVAFVLRNLGRATLIGQPTRGIGRDDTVRPVGDGFAVSITVTRKWDPCTGQEWERTGVEPHVRVSSAQALDEARRLSRTPERYRPGPVPQRECRTAPAARTDSGG
ncbi:MAG TPA: S41 family peptidase [Longimicrobium sp.]|nr:S41 family peptidase [Longimicrobium sp.]